MRCRSRAYGAFAITGSYPDSTCPTGVSNPGNLKLSVTCSANHFHAFFNPGGVSIPDGPLSITALDGTAQVHQPTNFVNMRVGCVVVKPPTDGSNQ